MLERARAQGAASSSGCSGDAARAPVRGRSFDAATVGFGVRNVADLELGLARAAPRAAARRPRSRSSRSRARAGRCAPFYRALVRPGRPAARQGAPRRRGLHVPARERAPLPRPGGAGRRCCARPASRDVRVPAVRRRDRRAAHGGGRDDRAPAGDPRARRASTPTSTSSRRGSSGRSRADRRRRGRGRAPRRSRPAASGCGRCSSSSRRRPDARPPVAAGVAVELVHMATLVHDDLIDGARVRRGRAVGLVGLRPATRRARPATTSSRARSRSSPRPATPRPSRILADACALPRARRGAAAPPARTTRTTTGRRLPRALRAEDREAVRGGVPARRARRGARTLRARARRSPSRSPTTSSTAPATRSRRARSPAPTCARGRRRCRCCSPRARTRSCARRSPAGRSDGRARARRRHRRARACARGRARVLTARAGGAERRPAPRRAGGARRARRQPAPLTSPVRMDRRSSPGRTRVIRLGRISYVNMAPVFHRLDAEVEEVSGVPTELNRRCSRASSTSRRSRRSSGRERRPAAAPAAAVRLVGGRGRVDPARLAHAARAGAHASRSRPRAPRRSCSRGCCCPRPSTCRSARRRTRSC